MNIADNHTITPEVVQLVNLLHSKLNQANATPTEPAPLKPTKQQKRAFYAQKINDNWNRRYIF